MKNQEKQDKIRQVIGYIKDAANDGPLTLVITSHNNDTWGNGRRKVQMFSAGKVGNHGLHTCYNMTYHLAMVLGLRFNPENGYTVVDTSNYVENHYQGLVKALEALGISSSNIRIMH